MIEPAAWYGFLALLHNWIAHISTSASCVEPAALRDLVLASWHKMKMITKDQ